MNNLSTANSTGITSQIGALELDDHLESYGDGALEAAGEFGGPPTAQTKLQGGCTYMCTLHCIGDGALEAAGATTIAPVTNNVPMTICCR